MSSKRKNAVTLYVVPLPLILVIIFGVAFVSTVVVEKLRGVDILSNSRLSVGINPSGTSLVGNTGNTEKSENSGKNILNTLKTKKDGIINDLTTIEISEQQLNKMIQEQAVGQGVGEYTLSSAEAQIEKDKVVINASLNDGTEVLAEIAMSENGQDIIIKDLKLENAGFFSSVKETLIRTFLKSTLEKILNKNDEGSSFVRAELTTDLIKIYLLK